MTIFMFYVHFDCVFWRENAWNLAQGCNTKNPNTHAIVNGFWHVFVKENRLSGFIDFINRSRRHNWFWKMWKFIHSDRTSHQIVLSKISSKINIYLLITLTT